MPDRGDGLGDVLPRPLEVARDECLGHRVGPARDLVRIRTGDADLQQAGVAAGHDLDHGTEGAERIGVLHEHRVRLETEQLYDASRDVTALDDFDLRVVVLLFGEPAVAGGTHARNVLAGHQPACLRLDLDDRRRSKDRSLQEGPQRGATHDNQEYRQQSPAPLPDDLPVIAQMRLSTGRGSLFQWCLHPNSRI